MTLLTEPAIVTSTNLSKHLYAFTTAAAPGETTCPRQYGCADRLPHRVLFLF
jgi:hypothetical protein